MFEKCHLSAAICLPSEIIECDLSKASSSQDVSHAIVDDIKKEGTTLRIYIKESPICSEPGVILK